MKTVELTNEKMSSREISQITGKNHSDILRAIRKMETAWEKVTESKFTFSEYTDSTGRRLPEYQLTKMECLYVSTKFNDEARALLIVRWHQLELDEVNFSKNRLLIASGIEMKIIPSDQHVFLVSTAEFSNAINVSAGSIRSSKSNHKDKFVDNIHFIDDFPLRNEAQNLDYKGTVWTKKGIIEHAYHLRTGYSKQLRDWVELELTGRNKSSQKTITTSKRNHNRLTQERILLIMKDIYLIEDNELRIRLSDKLLN